MIPLPDKIQGKVEDIRIFFRPYATETTPAKVEALRVFYGPELVAEAHEEGYVVVSAPEHFHPECYQGQYGEADASDLSPSFTRTAV